MRDQQVTGAHHPPSSLLRRLRALAPDRHLRLTEALNLAELQANRFLEFSGMRFAEPVPLEIVTDLPHVVVADDPSLPFAGTSHWDSDRRVWVISLNPTYSASQRRITLLHEFKHIIDFRSAPTADAGPCDDHLAEQTADHFAGCVLLPKRAVRHAWGSTAFTVAALAAHFDVPESVARARLQQLRLGHAAYPSTSATELEAA